MLPNIPGLDFWASATTPTQLSADANGNLIDQAFSSNGTFDETVWVSEDPTYAATGAACPSITLDAEATIGDPETEELSDAVPTTPRATGHLPQVCFVPTDQINLTKDFGQSPIVIENTVRTEAIEYFLKQTKTTIGEWTSIEVSSDADLAVGSAGYAGILRTVMSKAAYVHQSGGSVSYGCDFSGSKIGFMAYAVTLKQQTGGSFSFEGVPIPAPPTSEHELWHTDGARPSPTPFAIAKRLGETPPSARKGYVYGAHAVVTKLMNSILKPLLSYPDDHPSARNDAWCLCALNYCFDQYYMDKAVGAWIIDNGSYHTGPGGTQWNTQGNEKTGQVRLSEDRRDCTSCSLPISDLAGWPWAVARPGLPQIRTWTH